MTGQPTVLAVLLQQRDLQRYGSFKAAYNKAARAVDRTLGGTAPSRAQFHRWLTGDVRGLPYPDHCRVLEHLLAGYSARQLFQSCPSDGAPAPAGASTRDVPGDRLPVTAGTGMDDLTAIFASRSDFVSKVQPKALFDDAQRIRAAGLSLNMICQQLADKDLRRLLTDGTHLTCLFLDPQGDAIKAREREEEHPPGFLSTLTGLNIDTLSRLRDRLPADAQERFRLRVYDETIRFNIVLVDDRTCVVQPYLPQARGIDAPTLLIRRNDTAGGLYNTFEQVYDSLQERSKHL